MTTPNLALLFLLIIVAKDNAIIIDRCNLTAILRDEGLEGFAGTTIAEWICLVFHSSGFDTSALNKGPKGTNHGIFFLSSRWWCNNSKTPYARNYCNLSCEELQDDNITDDIHCAKRVVQESKGFEAWRAWRRYCNGQDLKQYVAGCEHEVTLTPSQTTSVTTPATDRRPNATLSAIDLADTTFLFKGPPEPTSSLKQQPNTSQPAKGPPQPTTSLKKHPNTSQPAKGPPVPTLSIKEPPNTTPFPAKDLPQPTISIKEPPNSTLPENPISFNEPPNPTFPAEVPPKPAIPIKESSNSTPSTVGPKHSTLPAGGPPKSTVVIKEQPEDKR